MMTTDLIPLSLYLDSINLKIEGEDDARIVTLAMTIKFG